MPEQQITEDQAKQGLERALGQVKPLLETVRGFASTGRWKPVA